MKVIVFDLGGTLMEYIGMPHSWINFYKQGVEHIVEKNKYNISKKEIEETINILKSFNPRINYREIEYPAEYIFTKAFQHWNVNISIKNCIDEFWSGLRLKAVIFKDTIPVLSRLKKQGYIISTLTDLPSAMPDYIFKKDIQKLTNYFDYYVSSEISGYRKPNSKGLEMIAEKHGIPVENIIFVGDEEKDKETALNFGCRFIQINRAEIKEGCINSLDELINIIT